MEFLIIVIKILGAAYLILNWIYIFFTERRSDTIGMFKEKDYVRLLLFLVFGLAADFCCVAFVFFPQTLQLLLRSEKGITEEDSDKSIIEGGKEK